MFVNLKLMKLGQLYFSSSLFFALLKFPGGSKITLFSHLSYQRTLLRFFLENSLFWYFEIIIFSSV